MDLTKEEFKLIAEEFVSAMLNGSETDDMCFKVCTPLYNYLEAFEAGVKLAKGDFDVNGQLVEHYWIDLGNGLILDPTADQLSRLYGLPELEKVYLGEMPNWYPKD